MNAKANRFAVYGLGALDEAPRVASCRPATDSDADSPRPQGGGAGRAEASGCLGQPRVGQRYMGSVLFGWKLFLGKVKAPFWRRGWVGGPDHKQKGKALGQESP